jgi:hypothetical protein
MKTTVTEVQETRPETSIVVQQLPSQPERREEEGTRRKSFCMVM